MLEFEPVKNSVNHLYDTIKSARTLATIYGRSFPGIESAIARSFVNIDAV